MPTLSLVAKLDQKGSETAKYYHYTFGRVGGNISGGLYISKDCIPPTALAIDIPDVQQEKEGELNAKR